MIDILCLGEALIELNQTQSGDGPDGAALYRLGCGGDTSNCAVAAARLGARTAYWTRLGADGFGDVLMARWAAERIDASRVVRDPAAFTGAYVVHHGSDGHRFSYLRQGSAASRMTPLDLPADLFEGVRLLHLSAISQAISQSACDTGFEAIERARAAGALVAYDTNLRQALWPLPRARAVIDAAIAQADIVLPSLDDARLLTGLEAPEAVAAYCLDRGARIVALTLGRDGALIATAERRERIAAFPVEAIDATGAGDAFDGAFLTQYLEHGDPFAAGRFANAAAALSTRGYGAVDPLPLRAEVEALLLASAATRA
ncbi:MAG: sugar kinase [Geminicoccaceae bacterium]|nr:MAG: sugar kinase [Geminicoccaceae bacterium]